MSRLQSILLGIFIFLFLLNGYLFYGYLQTRGEGTELETELSQVKQRTAALKQANDVAPLKAELAQLEADIAARSADYPDEPTSVALSDYLEQAARESNVEITSLSTNLKDDEEEINGQVYDKNTFELTVKGELTEVISFTEKAESPSFASVRVEDIDFTREDEEDSEGYSDDWEASLTVVLLTRAEAEE